MGRISVSAARGYLAGLATAFGAAAIIAGSGGHLGDALWLLLGAGLAAGIAVVVFGPDQRDRDAPRR